MIHVDWQGAAAHLQPVEEPQRRRGKRDGPGRLQGPSASRGPHDAPADRCRSDGGVPRLAKPRSGGAGSEQGHPPDFRV
jgi:hypothetical protein